MSLHLSTLTVLTSFLLKMVLSFCVAHNRATSMQSSQKERDLFLAKANISPRLKHANWPGHMVPL